MRKDLSLISIFNKFCMRMTFDIDLIYIRFNTRGTIRLGLHDALGRKSNIFLPELENMSNRLYAFNMNCDLKNISSDDLIRAGDDINKDLSPLSLEKFYNELLIIFVGIYKICAESSELTIDELSKSLEHNSNIAEIIKEFTEELKSIKTSMNEKMEKLCGQSSVVRAGLFGAEDSQPELSVRNANNASVANKPQNNGVGFGTAPR